MATSYIFGEDNVQYLITIWDDGTARMAIKETDLLPHRWSAPIPLLRTESIDERII
jgi:hypothetical protein